MSHFSINNGEETVSIIISPNWETFASKVKSVIAYKAKATAKDDAYFDIMAVTADEENVIGDLLLGSRTKLINMMGGFNRHFLINPIRAKAEASEEEKAKSKYSFEIILDKEAADKANSFLIEPSVSEFYVNDVIAEWLEVLRNEESVIYRRKADENLSAVFKMLQSFVITSRKAKELGI